MSLLQGVWSAEQGSSLALSFIPKFYFLGLFTPHLSRFTSNSRGEDTDLVGKTLCDRGIEVFDNFFTT